MKHKIDDHDRERKRYDGKVKESKSLICSQNLPFKK
jgi:hypothetical protein